MLEVLVPGVDVHRDKREINRRALAQQVERLHERPAVFAARQPHHYPVAIGDQVEIDDGLGGLLGNPRFEGTAVGHL